ncbi:hypothetical protein [Formosa sp. PL04]|uniref:hypothetical protein n=1 Tax=Formosa sp. PL04 TaxID=3081755 RepID=UPI002981F854|nr:hypothetical protein [Formosa sp. PL04]MDW5289228.1 hypothetical protein [Formosa sp. PL04]
MKSFQQLIALFLLFYFCSLNTYGQKASRDGVPKYVTVSYQYWDLEESDLDLNTWKMGEQEYFDKVTSKNEYIRSSTYYLHRFSDDSSEILLVQSFNSWEDIDKSANRNSALEIEAWPNKEERLVFLKKMSSFFQLYHSDEIYASLPQIKPLTEFATPEKELLLYVRRSHFSKNGNGPDAEFESLQKLYLDKIFKKNEYIKGYYANVHAWGSDKTEFIEAFYVRSYADLDQMFIKNDELLAKAWENQSDKLRMDKRYASYFTGKHGDFIYVAVPEFSK